MDQVTDTTMGNLEGQKNAVEASVAEPLGQRRQRDEVQNKAGTTWRSIYTGVGGREISSTFCAQSSKNTNHSCTDESARGCIQDSMSVRSEEQCGQSSA